MTPKEDVTHVPTYRDPAGPSEVRSSDVVYREALKAARGPDPKTKLSVQVRVSATVPDAKAVAVKNAVDALIKAIAAEGVEVRGGADCQFVYAEAPPKVAPEPAPVYYTRPDNPLPEPVPSQRMPNPAPSPDPHPLVGPPKRLT